MKRCRYCSAEISDDAKFCPNCGGDNSTTLNEKSFSSDTKFCPNCGMTVDSTATFCPQCGALINQKNNTGYTDYVASSQTQTQSNGFAIAGFICAFIIPLLGWIFGGIGLSKSKKLGGKGRSLSIAALIIATIMWILNFIVTLINNGIIS